MQNLSHTNLIQKNTGVKNASALLQNRKKLQPPPQKKKNWKIYWKNKRIKKETKEFLWIVSWTKFVNSILLLEKKD